ncbi:hypothetical protein CcCBS67573_g09101 [Chytriomyces confervae]|uniref:GATA-type domain-containing protein n=1 Tax=Chytriomyces confervae TaxID=246404 RepID=A0A507E7D4_9FUNG|nr:hypothetical protein CcCBS67573_g09101 [Chytriomyces confervae]
MNAQKPDTTSTTSSSSTTLQQHSHSIETKPNTHDPQSTKQDPTTHIQPLLKHPAPKHTNNILDAPTTTSKTIHTNTPTATTSTPPPNPNPTTTTTKKSRRKKKETEIYKCINCCITETSLWRRDDDGNPICNPCGLYFRLHNKPRRVVVDVPTVIRRRKRLSSIGSANSAGAGVVVEAAVKQVVGGELGGEEKVVGVHAVAGIAGGDGIAGAGRDGVAAAVRADGSAAGVVGDGLDKDTDDDDGGLGSTHAEHLRKASIDCSGEGICALLVLANVANAVQASQE